MKSLVDIITREIIPKPIEDLSYEIELEFFQNNVPDLEEISILILVELYYSKKEFYLSR